MGLEGDFSYDASILGRDRKLICVGAKVKLSASALEGCPSQQYRSMLRGKVTCATLEGFYVDWGSRDCPSEQGPYGITDIVVVD